MEKNNPKIILLNAESRVKTTPIKPRRSTVQTIEAEDIKVTKLPNQEESGDSDELVDNEEDDDNTYLLKQIQEVDWAKFDFTLPNSRYRPRKDGPSKEEWYKDLVNKCKVRDMFEWMVEQGDDLAQYSTDLVNLIDIKAKLDHWTAFKYSTSKALHMLERVQQTEDNKQDPPVEESTTGLVSATAKPVKLMNPAEIIKTLGIHHDRVINKIADSLNHVLHHVSVL